MPLNTGHESFVRFQQNAIERNRAVIFKTCKNPELAIKWLDNLASTENSFLSFYGYEGTHITKKDDGTYDAIDANYSTRALEVPVNNTGAFLITEEIASRVNKTGTDALRKKFVEAYAPYRIDSAKVYPNLVLQPEQSEGLVDAGLSEWQDYCYTTLAKWIVEGGIDDEWDDYVAQITSMAAPQSGDLPGGSGCLLRWMTPERMHYALNDKLPNCPSRTVRQFVTYNVHCVY